MHKGEVAVSDDPDVSNTYSDENLSTFVKRVEVDP
jgi:hypothetical protein